MPSGFSASTPQVICPDAGTLSRDIASTPTVFGLTRGGLTFTPDVEYRDPEFDGKRTEFIEGMTRVVKRGGTISGTFIELGAAQFVAYEPGSTPTVVTTITTIVPQVASTPLAAGAYLTNLTLSFDRGDGGSVDVIFAKALCTKYELKSTDPGEVEVACEFKAVLGATAAAASTDTAPYVVKITDPA